MFDAVFVDAFVPSSAVLFFQRAGLTAPEPDAEGTRRLALDSEQILALFDVGGMPGTAESPMPDAVETSGTYVGRKLIALLESDPGVWRYGDILAVFEAEGESYFFEPS